MNILGIVEEEQKRRGGNGRGGRGGGGPEVALGVRAAPAAGVNICVELISHAVLMQNLLTVSSHQAPSDSL